MRYQSSNPLNRKLLLPNLRFDPGGHPEAGAGLLAQVYQELRERAASQTPAKSYCTRARSVAALVSGDGLQRKSRNSAISLSLLGEGNRHPKAQQA